MTRKEASEQCMIVLGDERRRVLELIDAHRHDLGPLHARLWNLISNGVDLCEELDKPLRDRVSGFHWPDQDAKRANLRIARMPAS